MLGRVLLAGGMLAAVAVGSVAYAVGKMGTMGDGKIHIWFTDDGKCNYEVSGTEKQVNSVGNPCIELIDGKLSWDEVVVDWEKMKGTIKDSSETQYGKLKTKLDELKKKAATM